MLYVILVVLVSATSNMCLAFSPERDVTTRIDAYMKKLYYTNPISGTSVPNVCIVCDQFTGCKGELVTPHLLKSRSHFFACPSTIINEDLKKSYVYSGLGKVPWMKDCLFSPRAVYDADKKKS
jgi:hypothetical protein